MGRIGRVLGTALLCAGQLAPALAGQPAASAAPAFSLHGPASTGEAREFIGWIGRSGDNAGLPFAVVDKKAALLHVFDRKGRLVGSSHVLLGQAIGDDSAPGVGEHAQSGKVPLDERTTPAGRFVSEPGLNSQGEPVVWVDYEAAFAIHRLRPGPSRAPREVRLASLSPADHRVSYGCVVVPETFYKAVVQRVLGHSRAIVYVLPETRAVSDMFGAL
jgi:hypothetical protein